MLWRGATAVVGVGRHASVSPLVQVCICCGILLGFVANMVLSPSWQWQFFAGIPLAAMLFAAFLFVTPYSPRWLVTKGRVEEARRVLLGLRGDEGLAESELATIEHTVAETATIDVWGQLTQRHVLWAVALGVILSFIQQWSGCNAVNACA